MYYACRLEVNLRDKIPSTRSGLFTNRDYPVFRMKFRTYSNSDFWNFQLYIFVKFHVFFNMHIKIIQNMWLTFKSAVFALRIT